jgi:predicted  nucleic acid-binding Zn-ribbon protein
MNDYEALLRLQQIDLELMRDSRRLKAMPQQKRIAAADAAKRKVAGELTKIVGQRKDAELELQDAEAEHEHLMQKTDEVKALAQEGDYRQASSIEQQLTSLAKKMEKIEFNYKEMSDRLKRLQKAERNARDLDAKLDEERTAQQASFERDTADIMARVRQLAEERKRMVAALDEDTLSRYDAAAKRFGGLAVEKLEGNVPSICRVKLQPSLFSDLKHAGSITECPYCHRLLVTEEVAD